MENQQQLISSLSQLKLEFRQLVVRVNSEKRSVLHEAQFQKRKLVQERFLTVLDLLRLLFAAIRYAVSSLIHKGIILYTGISRLVQAYVQNSRVFFDRQWKALMEWISNIRRS